MDSKKRLREDKPLKKTRKKTRHVDDQSESVHGDIVAVKCIRSIEKYTHSAKIETRILRKMYTAQKAAHVQLLVKLYTSFTHYGHYCMVFEPLGQSLLDYIQKNKYCGFPLTYVRLISAQLLSALTFMTGQHLIHTDLKLENILFVPSEDIECYPNIKLIDFGGATHDEERKSRIINTRQYRGPEVTLELGWSYPSDVWSAACIIAELFTGDLLFATHNNFEHLAMMQKMLGKFPTHMIHKSPVSGTFFYRSTSEYRELHTCNRAILNFRTVPLNEVDSLKTDLESLLYGLLALDPNNRLTAWQGLQHEFFDPLERSGQAWAIAMDLNPPGGT
eukprot:GSChrysophyteH1.ASY1.ANO1.2569.1 assembled CDS